VYLLAGFNTPDILIPVLKVSRAAIEIDNDQKTLRSQLAGAHLCRSARIPERSQRTRNCEIDRVCGGR
jgi:hypothetical protein